MSGPDRRAAFSAERAELLAFCASLGPADWRMDSRAPGWSVQDVIAHLGSSCHAMFSPALLTLMRSADVEAANDDFVERRRHRNATEVLREYRRWSRLFGTSIPVLTGPLGGIGTPLAELGRFPMRLVPSAMVFDHHTHLRYDLAPALHRSAPGSDANRMAAVLEWMTAVLSNQLRRALPPWLDRPLTITLSGPGGGTWRVETDGTLTPGTPGPAAAQITAAAEGFPEWGTKRADWRERDVSIGGDADYATHFLDHVNVV